jgi:hypothetical protein
MFERQGVRYGPVTTQTIESLCRAGVIMPSTSVYSNIAERWSFAVSVPAMRPWLAGAKNPGNADELLRDIPTAGVPRDGASTKASSAVSSMLWSGRGWFILLFIAGVLTVSDLHQMSHRAQVAKAAPDDPQARLTNLPGNPKPTREAKPATPAAIPKTSRPLIDLTVAVNGEMSESQMRYLGAVRQAHFEKMLSFQSLTVRGNYATSRRECNVVYNALSRAEQEQRRIADSIPTRVRGCDVSDEAKKSYLAGVTIARPAEDQFLQQNVALERQQIDEVVAVLDLVQPYADRLASVNGEIIFPRPDIANQFNEHIHKLQALSASEKQLVAQHEKDVQQRLAALASAWE